MTVVSQSPWNVKVGEPNSYVSKPLIIPNSQKKRKKKKKFMFFSVGTGREDFKNLTSPKQNNKKCFSLRVGVYPVFVKPRNGIVAAVVFV